MPPLCSIPKGCWSPGDQPVVEALRTEAAVPPGVELVCSATHVNHDLMPAPSVLAPRKEGPSAVQLLWTFWRVCQEEGYPWHDHLFRPLSRDGICFEERSGAAALATDGLRSSSLRWEYPTSPSRMVAVAGLASMRETWAPPMKILPSLRASRLQKFGLGTWTKSVTKGTP
jgi:hypothetical protein